MLHETCYASLTDNQLHLNDYDIMITILIETDTRIVSAVCVCALISIFVTHPNKIVQLPFAFAKTI